MNTCITLQVILWRTAWRVAHVYLKELDNPPMKTRLFERHFIGKIPHNPILKSWPNPTCQGCNFFKNEMAKMGFEPRTLPRQTTMYKCKQCNIPLCITPCFEIYHTVDDYRRTLLLRRLPDH